MYLSILKKNKGEGKTLSERLSRAIEICNKPYVNYDNEQNVHRMVCDLAGGTKRKTENLLYRKINDDISMLYIQSDHKLDKKAVDKYGYELIEELNVEDIFNSIGEKGYVHINAKLAPTKCVNGKKLSLPTYEERIKWIERVSAANGFQALAINEGTQDHITFDKTSSEARNGSGQFLNAYAYHIAAKVTDPDLFKNAIHVGIGRGKAYGCGLVVIKPVK